MTSRTHTIAYWTATSLTAFVLASGGLAQLSRQPQNIAGIVALGYPAYVCSIVGFWKLWGALAIVWPRFPRVKEWAYAGAVFEFTGAAASQAFAGGPLFHVLAPLLLALLALASWALRPADRTLGTLALRA